MKTCTICHFEVSLDDIAVDGTPGRAICLRCYTRLAETWRPMPRVLRLQVETCLAELIPESATSE